jgi:hypothetical protein
MPTTQHQLEAVLQIIRNPCCHQWPVSAAIRLIMDDNDGQQSMQYDDIRFVNEFAPKFLTIAANVSMSCPISSTSGGIDYRVVVYATNGLQNSGGGIALVNRR